MSKALDQAALLLGLLEREQQLLRAGDADALPALCRDKNAALVALAGVLRAPAALDAGQRQALRELVLRCQRQTDANQVLLDARLRQTRGAIALRHGPAARYDLRGRGRYEVAGSWRGTA